MIKVKYMRLDTYIGRYQSEYSSRFDQVMTDKVISPNARGHKSFYLKNCVEDLLFKPLDTYHHIIAVYLPILKEEHAFILVNNHTPG